jgi:hypothetical protein
VKHKAWKVEGTPEQQAVLLIAELEEISHDGLLGPAEQTIQFERIRTKLEELGVGIRTGVGSDNGLVLIVTDHRPWCRIEVGEGCECPPQKKIFSPF